ncbi:hypothetical protein MKX64_15440 [Paenibacillus sp. FSL M8-0334]|uniref:hypothetical protein n=1 Tax=Paenibacillus sp. FSL M8-0334 TaxID=2921623 RepID=UPI0030F76777
MNTRSEAYAKIQTFLQSEDKGLLLTGTHQFIKHKLALKVIADSKDQSSSILFRANSMQNLSDFFERNSNIKTGKGYKLGKHKLYFDTINKTSWKNTRSAYDFSILYPVDALMRNEKLYKDILTDLYERRRINKIILVSLDRQSRI